MVEAPRAWSEDEVGAAADRSGGTVMCNAPALEDVVAGPKRYPVVSRHPGFLCAAVAASW